ncbi:inorganic phosphate transporter [Streptomyces profundus]|uniref:inorganic phosphate transporter n=1 Tax=Streptomyces profundus TaxID=2867410 RepID=UPI001D169720|nr:inorganic phosphate transporter [Streptomyces sp. MA3_2.13]UED83489.1 inorganic phosphate transporter [Streptomyces sp. MA3_2.13]
MEHFTLLIAIVIVTALAFDFTNGFHDTANAMATTISTGAMKPKPAVAMSAILNLVGAFLSVEVARTISGGIIDEEAGIKPEVIFAGLVGAILWNLLTWLAGLPSSSSHALFGGLIGATAASVGFGGINGDAVITKVVIPAVAAPLVAGFAAVLATKLTYRITRGTDEKSMSKGYRTGQIASAALVSLAHGTNDAQKTMGVMTLALIAGGSLAPNSDPPLWVITSAGVAIALGTYLGGWRIIRTMGKGLTDIRPPQGFAAQTSAATTILASSHMGFALSTTQVCSGAVTGSGLGRRGGVVRWNTVSRMVAAWLLTLPAAALVGALGAVIAERGDWGVAVVAVLLVASSALIWMLSRRKPVDHSNVNDDGAPASDADRVNDVNDVNDTDVSNEVNGSASGANGEPEPVIISVRAPAPGAPADDDPPAEPSATAAPAPAPDRSTPTVS